MPGLPVATRVMALFIVGLLLVPAAHAQDEPDLSKINLGSYASGPKINTKDLKGRVVVVEYWGITCPPCIDAIPHVTELAQEYGHDKVIIIANQSWSASDRRTKEVWETHAKSDAVAVRNGAKLPGFNPASVPRAVMFDHEGNKIWEGFPTMVDGALAKAVANVPDQPEQQAQPEDTGPAPIVTDVQAKYYAKQVESINEQRGSIDRHLIQLRRAVEKDTNKPERIEEASAVLAVVDQWAAAQQSEITALKASDPTTAYARLEAMQALLGRDTAAQAFTDLKEAMESDKPLMDTVRATRMLRSVLASASSIGLSKDNTEPATQSKHRRTVRTIDRDLGKIIDAWPETEAAKQATQLREDWGLAG